MQMIVTKKEPLTFENYRSVFNAGVLAIAELRIPGQLL